MLVLYFQKFLEIFGNRVPSEEEFPRLGIPSGFDFFQDFPQLLPGTDDATYTLLCGMRTVRKNYTRRRTMWEQQICKLVAHC